MSTTVLLKLKSAIYAISAILGVTLLQGSILYIYNFLCSRFIGVTVYENTYCEVVYYIIYSVITACVFYALYRRIEVGRSGVRFDATVIRVCGLIILGVALQSLAYGALNFITLFAQQSETLDSYSSMMENLNGTKTMWIFLYTMLFAPIVEETVFRGFIFKSCRMGFGVIGANVIQALGFAIFHGNIVQAIYAFVLGMFLGYVMFQRESLIEVIGLHIVINAAGIFIAPVAAAIITVFAGREIAYTVLIVTSLTLVAGWVIIQNRLKKAEIIL